MELKVTTFNIRYDFKGDLENSWSNRAESVVQFLKENRSDIIGLQEVLDHMRKDIDSHFPNYTIIGMTRTVKSEATPIMFNHDKFDLKEYGTFWLSKTPRVPDTKDFNSHCYRICTWAEFSVRENRNIRFRVFNTHLDHESKLAQHEGIRIVYNKIKEKNSEEYLPSIVMGDFNVKPDNDVINYIVMGKGKRIDLPNVNCHSILNDEENKRGTFHDFTGRTGGEPIDYIFVTQDIKLKHTEICREKVNGRYVSDHYPVNTILDIK